MKTYKFAVPVVLDFWSDEPDKARTPDKVFLVEAESPRKAVNAVNRHCKEHGISTARIDEAIVAEALPITVMVGVSKPRQAPKVKGGAYARAYFKVRDRKAVEEAK
jgi:hypothetical protein